MAFASLEQLKTRSWPTLSEATVELKRNGLKPVGLDYQLAETDTGNWYIAERSEVSDGIDAAPIPAAVKQEEPEVVKQSKPARGKKSPDAAKAQRKAEVALDRKRAAFKETAAPASAPEPEPEPEPEPAPPSEPVANAAPDLSDLGDKGRPYHYRLGHEVAQFRMPETALAFSRKLGLVIQIVDKTGKVVRVMDGRSNGTAATGRVAGAPKKQDAAIALLLRKEGATTKELTKVMGWNMGLWHVSRIAQSKKMTLTTLAEKHWRLEQH